MPLLMNKAEGDKYVNRQQLAEVKTPQRTATWHPVPHIELVEAVDAIVKQHGWSIQSEKFGLVRDSQKMFGVMTLNYDKGPGDSLPEYTRCIGIRNSHDKSLCAGITAGVSVLVCSNLCFGGTYTFQRRHTSGIDLNEMVGLAMTSLLDEFLTLECTIGKLHDVSISYNQARCFIVKAAEQGAIPGSDILPVFNEFQKPKHEEFRKPTRWSLLNAFTEIAGKYAPTRSELCHRKLTSMFGLDGQPALL